MAGPLSERPHRRGGLYLQVLRCLSQQSEQRDTKEERERKCRMVLNTWLSCLGELI
ncbi:unnamed protein product [Trifolium pratense]|uniref:Uncharacterized protein n=1 Tax=Trifolium pratense TaxID=57577 RepID=A0ACB0L5N2_TRIPR|nr:unnamed protein product [Trifolium pratense]